MAPAVMPSAHAGPKWSTTGSDIFHGNDSAPFGGSYLDEASEEEEQHQIFSAMIQAGQESASVSGRSSRTSGEASSSSAGGKRDKRKSPPERLQTKHSGRRHPWALALSPPMAQRSPPPTGPPPAAPLNDAVELVDEARTPTVLSSFSAAAAARERRPRERNFSRPERHADRTEHQRTTSEADNKMEPAWADDQSCIDSSPMLDSDPFKAQAPKVVPTLGQMELQKQTAAQLERERDRLRDSMVSPVGSERMTTPQMWQLQTAGQEGPAEAFEVAALRRQVEQLQMALRQRSAHSFGPSSNVMSPPLSKAHLAPYFTHAHLGAGGLPTPTDSRSAASSRHSPQSKGARTPSLAPHDFDAASSHQFGANGLPQQHQAHLASLRAQQFPPHSIAPPQLSPQQMAAYEQLYGMPAPPSLAHYAFPAAPMAPSVHHHHSGLPSSSLPYLTSPAPTTAPLSPPMESGPSSSLQHHLTLMEEASAALYGPGSAAAYLRNLHSSSPSASVAPSTNAGEHVKLDELTAKIEALEKMFRLQAALSPSEASSHTTMATTKTPNAHLRPTSSINSDGRRASTSFVPPPQASPSQQAQPQAQKPIPSRLRASLLPRSPSLSDVNSESLNGTIRPRSPAMSAFNFNATGPYGGRSLFPSTVSSSGSSQHSRSGTGGALRRKAVARFILGVGSARRPEGGMATDLHAREKASGAQKMKQGPGRGVIRVASKN